MKVRKIIIADAAFERSPDQDGKVYAGNVIDPRHVGSVTIGYGRYASNQSIDVTLEMDGTMMVLEGLGGCRPAPRSAFRCRRHWQAATAIGDPLASPRSCPIAKLGDRQMNERKVSGTANFILSVLGCARSDRLGCAI